MPIFVALLCFLFTPVVAEAAVTISEIAWMGSAASANDEWIELYNTGGEVVVDDWILTDEMNFSITLFGTLPSGYSTLERTDDDSAAGSAFLIYTGALPNTGATLILKDASGNIVDQVAGGEDWQNIGGDNVTKETAQYTDRGWITAAATPGSSNATVGSVKEDEGETKSSGTTKSVKKEEVSGAATQRVAAPETPSLSIVAPKEVYVNQPVIFKTKIEGMGKTITASLKYQWNFGDLATATGTEVEHHFSYPGEYVVAVEASFKEVMIKDRFAITVLPTNLSISTNGEGDVQIHNDAKYEMDISDFVVEAGKKLKFPKQTYLRPSATITIPAEKAGYYGQVVKVYDGTGKQVASTLKVLKVEDEMGMVGKEALPSAAPPADFSFSIPEVTIDKEELVIEEGDSFATSTPLSATVQNASRNIHPSYSYAALVGVVCLALVAYFSGRGRSLAVTSIPPSTAAAPKDEFPF